MFSGASSSHMLDEIHLNETADRFGPHSGGHVADEWKEDSYLCGQASGHRHAQLDKQGDSAFCIEIGVGVRMRKVMQSLWRHWIACLEQQSFDWESSLPSLEQSPRAGVDIQIDPIAKVQQEVSCLDVKKDGNCWWPAVQVHTGVKWSTAKKLATRQLLRHARGCSGKMRKQLLRQRKKLMGVAAWANELAVAATASALHCTFMIVRPGTSEIVTFGSPQHKEVYWVLLQDEVHFRPFAEMPILSCAGGSSQVLPQRVCLHGGGPTDVKSKNTVELGAQALQQQQQQQQRFNSVMQKALRCSCDLTKQQLRSLLRDVKIQKRVEQAATESSVKEIVLQAAEHVGMQTFGKRSGSAGSRKHVTFQKHDESKSRARSAPPSRKGNEETKDEFKKASVEECIWELLSEDWECPILRADELPTEHGAVYLVEDEDEAKKLWLSLSTQEHRATLVAPCPVLSDHVQADECVIRLRAAKDGKMTIQALRGFLHRVQGTIIKPKTKCAEVKFAKDDAAKSTVTRVMVERSKFFQSEFKNEELPDMLRNLVSAVVKAQVVIDTWATKVEGQYVTGLVRLLDSGMFDLLQSSGSKGIWAATPKSWLERYDLVWIPQGAIVAEVYAKLGKFEGHAGMFLKRSDGEQESYGIRVRKGRAEDLKQALDLPRGQVYLAHGLPLQTTEAELESVMKSIKWEASVLPNSRRCRKAWASFAVRVSTAPPLKGWPIEVSGEAWQVTVTSKKKDFTAERTASSTFGAGAASWQAAAAGRWQRQAGDEEQGKPKHRGSASSRASSFGAGETRRHDASEGAGATSKRQRSDAELPRAAPVAGGGGFISDDDDMDLMDSPIAEVNRRVDALQHQLESMSNKQSEAFALMHKQQMEWQQQCMQQQSEWQKQLFSVLERKDLSVGSSAGAHHGKDAWQQEVGLMSVEQAEAVKVHAASAPDAAEQEQL